MKQPKRPVEEFQTQAISYFIACDTPGQAERLKELIDEKGDTSVDPVVQVADLKGGFVCNQGLFAILTDHEIFQRYESARTVKRRKDAVPVSSFIELEPDDYVVTVDRVAKRPVRKRSRVPSDRQRLIFREQEDQIKWGDDVHILSLGAWADLAHIV